jgi:hypothetical protein
MQELALSHCFKPFHTTISQFALGPYGIQPNLLEGSTFVRTYASAMTERAAA